MMNMKKSLNRWSRSFPKDEDGVAALMAVIFAVVLSGTIAVNFLVESRQKQAGGALTYTSTNAFLAAETASSTSFGPASATSLSCCSVAGLIVAKCSPVTGSRNSPPTNRP